jgi:Xaa-Pro aminopeptidase
LVLSATGTERLRAAQESMALYGLDGLLVSGGRNFSFLTGFPSLELTLARPPFLILPRSGSPVVLVQGRRRYEMTRFSWVSDIRTYSKLSFAPVQELEVILRELSLFGGRVGAELGFEQRLGLPYLEFQRIMDELAPTQIVDAADLFWDLRRIRSAADLEAQRRACDITSEALQATLAWARAGVTEVEVAHRMRLEMVAAGGADAWVGLTSGTGNYDTILGFGTGRELEPGDMLWMDAGCSFGGFCSDFGRAGVVGGASREQLDAHAAIVDITQRAVAMVRPGALVSEIAAFCNSELDALRLPVTSPLSHLAGRVGHGVGLDTTEPPHVAEYDPTVLATGMVIAIEPGVATDFGVFHVEQNVLVTDDGPEVLSRAPWELAALRA